MFGFFDEYFLFFGLKITYYGFIIALAMALGVFVACKNAKKRGLTSDNILIACCYILPLAIIGARIYYVLFSLDQFHSFVSVLRIWDGGLAVYGSVIGGAIGVALYCIIHKHNFFDFADVAVPSLILGQAIGRIGCFFAGCCYGWEVTNPSVGLPFVTNIGGHYYLATFFYESFWNFLGFALLLFLLRSKKVKQRGFVCAIYLIYYGIGRAIIETFRGDSLYLGAIKVSQLLSIFLIIAGLAILIINFVGRKRAPQSGKQTKHNKEKQENEV